MYKMSVYNWVAWNLMIDHHFNHFPFKINIFSMFSLPFLPSRTWARWRPAELAGWFDLLGDRPPDREISNAENPGCFMWDSPNAINIGDGG